MLAMASRTESGWPRVRQASEVPQNQVILKQKISSEKSNHLYTKNLWKQFKQSHLRVGPVESLILWHCALEVEVKVGAETDETTFMFLGIPDKHTLVACW